MAGFVGAQQRSGETGSDAARRQNREANEQNQREINRAGDAYAPNGSSSDALLRQYQNQWRQQAEQEKANREAAAQAAQAARARAESLKAEQQRAANVRSDRIQYRIEHAMTMAMVNLNYPHPAGSDLTRLTFFSFWFSQNSGRIQSWKFLGQYGPGDRLEVAMAALERAYALGDRSAPWLAVALEGDMAWGGPPGLSWWLLLKANERAYDGSNDGVTDSDWALRGTIDWQDAQMSFIPSGILRAINPREPNCNYASAAAVEKLGREGYLAHLALAAAGHGGYLPLLEKNGWQKSSRVLPLLERMCEVNPGYGHLLTGLWLQDLRGAHNATAVTHLRQAEAAGGRAANFAKIALWSLENYPEEVKDIARLAANWEKNPQYFKRTPADLQRIAAYYVSGDPLDVVNPKLAALPPAERDQAAWQLALAALRAAVETDDYDSRNPDRLVAYATLRFLQHVAPGRPDLWPARLAHKYPVEVPSAVIQEALPGDAGKVYELLLKHPQGGAYATLRPGWNHFGPESADWTYKDYWSQFPELKIMAVANSPAQAKQSPGMLATNILQLQALDLPIPTEWYLAVDIKPYDVLTLYGSKRLLTLPVQRIIQGDPELEVQGIVTNWLAKLRTYDDSARQELRRAFEQKYLRLDTSDPTNQFSRALQFGADYLAAANGTPVSATDAWPVDSITPAGLARAAHLINASLGLHGAKYIALPTTHPSVVWVQQAANTNDPVAAWVWANRLQSQNSAPAGDYLIRAAQAGHQTAFARVYSETNLLANPALQLGLWDMLRAGHTNVAPQLVKLTVATCEQELPEGYDPATDKPRPQGDVLKVLSQLDRLTAVKAACPVVARRLLASVPTYHISTDLDTYLATSELAWIKDPKLRAQAFAAATTHIQQTMFYPGIANMQLVRAAIECLPQIALVRGGDTTYAEAETTLAAIITQWPGERNAFWNEQACNYWHVLAVQNRDRQALAASLRCYQRAVALTADDTVWEGYFEVAMANRSAADIKISAPRQLARKNEELLAASTSLFTSVAEALAGPYGLPADEARLKEMSRLLVYTTGGVPEALTQYAPAIKIPPVGSPEWQQAILTQLRRFSAEQQPEHAVKFCWELAHNALDLPSAQSADALIAPYQMLHRLAEDYGHAEAKAILAQLEKTGTNEQRARNACGDWWAVEPFNGADQFVSKAKAGEAWALRSLELWILWDKLPKYAVEENYLKEFPSLKTAALEKWLREH